MSPESSMLPRPVGRCTEWLRAGRVHVQVSLSQNVFEGTSCCEPSRSHPDHVPLIEDWLVIIEFYI